MDVRKPVVVGTTRVVDMTLEKVESPLTVTTVVTSTWVSEETSADVKVVREAELVLVALED